MLKGIDNIEKYTETKNIDGNIWYYLAEKGDKQRETKEEVMTDAWLKKVCDSFGLEYHENRW